MLFDFIGLIILLLLSGFFSSSELAFVVANKLKIEVRARKNKIAAKAAQYFVDDPNIFFSTILVGNNIVNVAFASLLTVFLLHFFDLNDFEILLISSSLLLLLGELIPKYIARDFADRLIILISLPLRLLSIILYPIVKLLSSISNVFVREAEIEEAQTELVDREDIQVLIDEGSEAGHFAESVSDIAANILELGEQKIYEAMTPRTDITGIQINSTIGELLDVFITSGYSKIPVYDESMDDIKGIVFAYDMFRNPTDIKSMMRKPKFVPDTKRSIEMLNEFLDERISIAIVVDEFGGTAGIITVEDIIEEMFGEIHDEYDVDDDVCKKINEDTYIISGKVEVDALNEDHDLDIPEGDYETLAGYITSTLGNIPQQGYEFKTDKFKITILRSDINRVGLIKLQVLQN